jgi:hypothetical protein
VQEDVYNCYFTAPWWCGRFGGPKTFLPGDRNFEDHQPPGMLRTLYCANFGVSAVESMHPKFRGQGDNFIPALANHEQTQQKEETRRYLMHKLAVAD